MSLLNNPQLCKSILDLAQAYGPYEFWVQNLRTGMNPAATWRALMVVTAFKDLRYADACRRLLNEKDSRVRAWACTALAALNHQHTLADIQYLEKDPSGRVRYHARRAARLMQGLPTHERHVHHPIPGANPRHLVLVSDDTPPTVEFFKLLLGRMGCLVESAASAEKTIELAVETFPQLIITDNQKMNDNLSGLNMTWDLCRRKELDDTLIFMVTSDLVEPVFLWSGGDAYFTKAPEMHQLRRKVEEYLRW